MSTRRHNDVDRTRRDRWWWCRAAHGQLSQNSEGNLPRQRITFCFHESSHSDNSAARRAIATADARGSASIFRLSRPNQQPTRCHHTQPTQRRLCLCVLTHCNNSFCVSVRCVRVEIFTVVHTQQQRRSCGRLDLPPPHLPVQPRVYSKCTYLWGDSCDSAFPAITAKSTYSTVRSKVPS